MTAKGADFTVYDLPVQGHYYHLTVQDLLDRLTAVPPLPSFLYVVLLLKCLLRVAGVVEISGMFWTLGWQIYYEGPIVKLYASWAIVSTAIPGF